MQISKLKKFVTPWNLLIFGLLLIAFVVRVWRIDVLLGFYYDQGRDGLVIWDLITKGKLFLIGPTTGIAGIFRGPFYYYLIAPFYFLGAGNPVFPAVFLVILSTVALWFLYKIAFEVGGKWAGIVSLVLGAFSFEMIYASRWLSNPTPMLFLSMVLVWLLFRIYEGKKKYWMWVALVLGLSQFSFGSSGELFYFPAVLIFALWNRKNLPDKNTLIKSALLFGLTFLPLFLFNLRHGGVLGGNIGEFGASAFGVSSAKFTYDRLMQVVGYFSSLIFHAPYEKEFLWLIALFATAIFALNKLLMNDKFKIIFLFLISPLIGLLFFKGNYGNIYGYYLTGYFSIFIVFMGVVLTHVFKESVLGKVFVILFLITFLNHNWFWTKGMLNTEIGDPSIIVLGNEVEAINWIYEDAGTNKFNVDIYVPPVIPHAYNYLLTWKKNPNNVTENVDRLYTLHEINPDHPERLSEWMTRQEGIGKIEETKVFGGITVERRARIK